MSNNIMKVSVFIFFLTVIFSFSQAQPLLTVEDAVNIVLKNNYDIRVARNNAAIDSINNTLGNAGMLPDIAITASNNYSPGSNVNQNLSGGNSLTYTNESNSLNTGIWMNWTVFDGGKMFVTKKKLNEIQALGEIQFKEQVLQTMYDVILAYYDVVRQKQQLTSIKEVISYNLERVKISQASFDAGLSPKTNLLQAKIDLNVYQENAINQVSVLIAAKRYLNELLSRNPETAFEVPDSIPLTSIPDQKELFQRLDSSNTSILALQKQVDVAKLSLKEVNTFRFPTIDLNAGYGFSQVDNTRGSMLMNRTAGPQIGGAISIPVYRAGNINRQIRVARVQVQSAQYNFESLKLQIKGQLQNALTQYENQQKLLDIEKANVILAKENLDITIQRLRLGQTTSLEVTQAEANYVGAQTRLINFSYNLKVVEAKLKQLVAGL